MMYADDIILLSSTSQGLQQELNILVQYCIDCCLSINTSKTKIIIFNKAGRLWGYFNPYTKKNPTHLILVLPRFTLT